MAITYPLTMSEPAGHQTSNGGVASTSSRGTNAEDRGVVPPFSLINAR